MQELHSSVSISCVGLYSLHTELCAKAVQITLLCKMLQDTLLSLLKSGLSHQFVPQESASCQEAILGLTIKVQGLEQV